MDKPLLTSAYTVVGIYIDVTPGDGIAGCRICLVQETPAGRLIVQPADNGPMAVLLNHLSADELAVLMDALHAYRKAA